MKLRSTHLTLLAALLVASACDSDVQEVGNDDDSGGSGPGGQGGGGGLPIVPGLDGKAPTQFSVEVTFNTTPPAEALDPARYTLDGDHGALVIESVSQGAMTNVITLTTNKQKLGVSYAVTFDGPDAWQGLADTFPSADTATFWTTDLGSPQFSEYEVTAARKAIGEHVVVYVQQDMFANNVADTVAYFDEQVYPTETALFNAEPDQDDNDRVLLLGLNGKGAYGGYFNPVDTFSDDIAFPQWGRHSNEIEMLYINVEGGAFDNEHVVAHEFSHMLYHVSHDTFEAWSWHNEGMAECAVHAVNGDNYTDVAYYVQDPQGGIRSGLSLVNWQFANFDQYVLSYMFLSYVAGQKEGVPTFGELFALDGSPFGFDSWLEQELGVSFAEAHQQQLAATWVQAPSGPYGYNGMITLPGTAPVGDGPFSLEPFSGTFRQPASPVSYPGTQGPDIVYLGINGLGAIDATEPFDVAGGALLVFNTSTDLNDLSPQPTGNPLPQIAGGKTAELAPVAELTRAMTWLHPPPFNPNRLDAMRQWQRVVRAR